MRRTSGGSRRDVLRAVGAVGVVGLTGCTSGGSSDGATADGGDRSADSGSDSSGESGTRTSTVEMTDDLKFDPRRIEIEAGTTVTWKNAGSIGHTVTAYGDGIPDGGAYFASGDFDSQSAAVDGYPDEGTLRRGESFEHAFETEGTYEYYCIPHEMNGMVGRVKVV